MEVRPLSLRHLALRVRDLEACERFYGELLGLRTAWRPDPDNVYLTGDDDSLALHRCGPGEALGAGALDHLGFVVPDAGDVDAWCERLRGQGVEPLAAPKTHRDGARSFHLRDPDGNAVQILSLPPVA